MTDEERVRDAFSQMADHTDICFPATVENNYPEKDYIDVRDLSGVLYPDVRKRAAITGGTAGILITPVVGSSVIVSRISESDELFVEMFSEVESVVIDGGEHGGLTITPELKTQLGVMSGRIDGIIAAIKTGVPVAGDGGASLKATIVAALDAMVRKEDFSKIENGKIRH
jgi:hypothetical protein